MKCPHKALVPGSSPGGPTSISAGFTHRGPLRAGSGVAMGEQPEAHTAPFVGHVEICRDLPQTVERQAFFHEHRAKAARLSLCQVSSWISPCTGTLSGSTLSITLGTIRSGEFPKWLLLLMPLKANRAGICAASASRPRRRCPGYPQPFRDLATQVGHLQREQVNLQQASVPCEESKNRLIERLWIFHVHSMRSARNHYPFPVG